MQHHLPTKAEKLAKNKGAEVWGIVLWGHHPYSDTQAEMLALQKLQKAAQAALGEVELIPSFCLFIQAAKAEKPSKATTMEASEYSFLFL